MSVRYDQNPQGWLNTYIESKEERIPWESIRSGGLFPTDIYEHSPTPPIDSESRWFFNINVGVLVHGGLHGEKGLFHREKCKIIFRVEEINGGVNVEVNYPELAKGFVGNILIDSASKFKESRSNISSLAQPSPQGKGGLEEQSEKQDQRIEKIHNEKTRKKRPRKDVIKRVALALFLEQKESLARRAAARRAHTTTESMEKYEDMDEVKKRFEEFKKNPDSAKQFQQKLLPRKRN